MSQLNDIADSAIRGALIGIIEERKNTLCHMNSFNSQIVLRCKLEFSTSSGEISLK